MAPRRAGEASAAAAAEEERTASPSRSPEGRQLREQPSQHMLQSRLSVELLELSTPTAAEPASPAAAAADLQEAPPVQLAPTREHSHSHPLQTRLSVDLLMSGAGRESADGAE